MNRLLAGCSQREDVEHVPISSPLKMFPTKGFVLLLPSFGPPNRERKVVAQRCHGQTASTIAAQTGQWSKKERERVAGEERRVINRRGG